MGRQSGSVMAKYWEIFKILDYHLMYRLAAFVCPHLSCVRAFELETCVSLCQNSDLQHKDIFCRCS